MRFKASPLTEGEFSDEHGYSLSDPMDESLPLFSYYIFGRLGFLILSYDFFMKSGNWLELDKYQFGVDAWSLVFAALYRSVTTVLKIVALTVAEREIVKLDKDGNPIRSSSVPDVPAFQLFDNPSVKYSLKPSMELRKRPHAPKWSLFGSVE